MLTTKQKINYFFMKLMPKKLYIKLRVFLLQGYIPNLKNPKTYTEKLQWRKLNDNNKLYSICADKYAVREYVKNKVGEEYLVPIYLITDTLTKEEFEKLPNSFVLKTTNGSGNSAVKIIKDKKLANYEELRDFFEDCKKIDVGDYTMESWYSSIPCKVMAEKLLDTKPVDDYKIHCFNSGKMIIEHLTERNKETGTLKSNAYNENWEKLNFTMGTELYTYDIKPPKNFEKMKEIAKKLSEDFDYVRVDLYNIDGNIYFGELTFCDAGGFGTFNPKIWDSKLGSYWEIKNN